MEDYERLKQRYYTDLLQAVTADKTSDKWCGKKKIDGLGYKINPLTRKASYSKRCKAMVMTVCLSLWYFVHVQSF
jgi:hypothetical protein